MSLPLKRALRLLAIVAAVTVVSLAFLPDSHGIGPYASTLDSPQSVSPVMGPKPCDKTACNTWCFADGCKKTSKKTNCVKTVMEPTECPTGTGGCVTRAC